MRGEAMASRKFIYWRPDLKQDADGRMFANVHYLVGYHNCSIMAYQEMAAEVRKTFPLATDDVVECGKVFRSSSVRGFAIVTWGGYLAEGEYPGWMQIQGTSQIEYDW